MSIPRRELLIGVGSGILAGCLGRDDAPDAAFEPNTTEVESYTLDIDAEQIPVGNDPPADSPSNAPPISDRVLSSPLPLQALSDEVVDGGIPKDGFPSVDEPTFLASDADHEIPEATTVFGIVHGGEAKAYSRRVLVQHEIVNDTIAGEAISLTYCPLTGTAHGYFRGSTEFGVSGRLLNNNLVMYDRERERWWAQILACSIPGEWSDTAGGATLAECNVVRTSLNSWLETYPESLIMSEETGYARMYGIDPYAERGYFSTSTITFPTIHISERHHPKAWVHGVRSDEGSVAFLRESLKEAELIHAQIGDLPVVAVWDSTLESAFVYRNPDNRRFNLADGIVYDEIGESYAPNAINLEQMIGIDAFWFAWVGFYPTSTFYE